jgi:hypothetical protein
MADPVRVKPEPDAGSPGVEDELDESTDLEFYDKSVQGDNSTMYLTRLPNYLWRAWAELGDDEEIQIGRVRQWRAPDGTMVSPLSPHARRTISASIADLVSPSRNYRCALRTSGHISTSRANITWK